MHVLIILYILKQQQVQEKLLKLYHGILEIIIMHYGIKLNLFLFSKKIYFLIYFRPPQQLDSKKTIFVGNLHGTMTARYLWRLMEDLFNGAVYAGVDIDKYKYP